MNIVLRLALIFVALIIINIVMAGCAKHNQSPLYVTTIQPLSYILREVVGRRGEVAVLLPVGASPHTYEPRPSDIKAVQSAVAMFYVGPVLDTWAIRLPAKRKIEVIRLVPETYRRPIIVHHHGEGMSLKSGQDGAEIDPHFWTDPLTVKAILPQLVDSLVGLNPGGSSIYRANAERFAQQLQRLHEELVQILGPLAGRRVVLFHPSFQYLFARYGIVVAAVIEPSPGKEPTPRYIEEVVKTIRAQNAELIFTEPQLPRRPAEVIAEVAGVKLAELDPLGGIPGRDTYTDLIRYNAEILQRNLK